MAKRKIQRHPTSGAPGIAQKRSAGAPALNPISRPHGFLDTNVAASLYKANHPSLRFVGLELPPVKPLLRRD